MKVAVVGTRTFSDRKMFEQYMARYVGKDDTIVTGDATGADAMARHYAAEQSMPFMVFPAKWKEHGIRAGPIRNQEIVDAADKIIAFWDGESKGTLSAIECARKKGIHLIVARFEK